MKTAQLAVRNSTSALTRRCTDPYGNLRGAVPTGWVGDHGFLDKPADATGLVAVGARYYDPVLGWFVSVDPVMDLADPQQWNGYAYAGNSPVTWSDPSGLLPDWAQKMTSAVGSFIKGKYDTAAQTVQEIGRNPVRWALTHQTQITSGLEEISCGGFSSAVCGQTVSLRQQRTMREKGIAQGAIEIYSEAAITLALGAVPYVGRAAKYAARPVTRAVAPRLSRLATRTLTRLAAKSFATGADEEVFWSGVGRGGDKIAAEWAAKNGGATLETTMVPRGITLPAWDAGNPAVVAAWRDASAQFARRASGNVRVLQGDAVRLESVWAQVEFPA